MNNGVDTELVKVFDDQDNEKYDPYPRMGILNPEQNPGIYRKLENNQEEVSSNGHDWIDDFQSNDKNLHVIMYAGKYEYETDTLKKHKTSFSSFEAIDFSKVNIAKGVDENIANQGLFEDGCGKDKGCFGSPSGCINYANCEVLVTYRKVLEEFGDDDEIYFELKVQNE